MFVQEWMGEAMQVHTVGQFVLQALWEPVSGTTSHAICIRYIYCELVTSEHAMSTVDLIQFNRHALSNLLNLKKSL